MAFQKPAAFGISGSVPEGSLNFGAWLAARHWLPKNPAVSGIRVVPISLALEAAWLQILAQYAHRSDFPKAPTVFGIFAFGQLGVSPPENTNFALFPRVGPDVWKSWEAGGDCTE